MRYLIDLSGEERDLLLQETVEMIRDENFCDKGLAEQTLTKLLYAKVVKYDETI